MYVCMYVCIYIYIYRYACMYIYIYNYIDAGIYVYRYICMGWLWHRQDTETLQIPIDLLKFADECRRILTYAVVC
jgi:hypothetical protein